MTKRKTSSKHLYSGSDKVQSMDKSDKLNHTDKITIDKIKYVNECSSWFGNNKQLINKISHKHLYRIKYYSCVGEYSMDQDKICLFSDGLEYFTLINNNTIEEQVARTISHEIMHRILFYEHGEHECRAFDNIAEKLKQYWMW